jgi:DNA modification methylase
MILIGDCRTVMAGMDAASVDAIVTDPPYDLTANKKGGTGAASVNLDSPYGRARIGTGNGAGGFMGKSWDGTGVAFDPATWAEAFRVLRPGGHLLAFGGTRTSHRMVSAIEDAGFEIRDSIMWVFGSGFPKSLDVSKAIDKQRDDKHDVLKVTAFVREGRNRSGLTNAQVDAAIGAVDMCDHWCRSSPLQAAVPTWEQWIELKALLSLSDEMDAEVWWLNGRKGQPGENWEKREVVGSKERQGKPPQFMWGDDDGQAWAITAPATPEAERWAGWGTALKPAHEPICVARKPLVGTVARNVLEHGTGALNIDASRIGTETITAHGGGVNVEGRTYGNGKGIPAIEAGSNPHTGRWPANVILSDSAAAALDAQSGERPSKMGGSSPKTGFWGNAGGCEGVRRDDTGGASRFFLTVPDLPIDGEDVTRCWLCEAPKHDIMNATQEVASCDHVSTAESHSSPTVPASVSVPADAPALLPPVFEDSTQSSRTYALNADGCLTSTPEINGSTVPDPVPTSPADQLAPRVKSAGDLCDSCATGIALRLAAMLRAHPPASIPGLESITGPRSSILTHSLVSYVEPMVGTGIIPTTASLSILFGSVRAAMHERTAADLAVARDANGHDRTGSLPIDDPGLTRFLYKSKASRAERNVGLDGMPEVERRSYEGGPIVSADHPGTANGGRPAPSANGHPTVKPIALMSWLITLVTPPGGTVLDPFAGSGSTGCAAAKLGVEFIGIEQDPTYAQIAERRIAYWAEQSKPTPRPQLPLFAEQAAD